MKNKRINNSNALSKEQKISQHNPTENFKVQLSYGSLVTHNCKNKTKLKTKLNSLNPRDYMALYRLT